MKRFDVLPNMKERLSELKGLTAASGETRLAVERERLLRGEKPRSMFSNRQQSAATRLLAGFFVMILTLTFLSRMAASLTFAEVSTGSARAGVLTQRYVIPGTIETRDTLDITLPGGLRISGVMVQEGDSIDAGDALLKLDVDGLQDAIEQLENEIGIIDMRIASLSLAVSSAETEQIRQAEDNLKYAREDCQRLLGALDASDASSVSGSMAEEDLLPQYPTLKPYIELLLDAPEFFTMFWNSCKQVFPIVAGQIAIGAPAAWAFARFRFRGKGALYALYIVLMLMPFQATMVSSYFVLDGLGLMNTVWAIILPGAVSTFPVFLMIRFFAAIPSALTEAVSLDGAGPWQIFLYLGLPLGAPGILSAVILGFLEYWNALE